MSSAVLTSWAALAGMALLAGCQTSDSAAPRAEAISLIGNWRLVAIRPAGAAEMVVAPEPPHTMTFSADGRVGGKADCNSYGGSYEQPGPGKLRIGNVVSTMMACLTPSPASGFLNAIGAIDRYEIVGTELRLTTGDDTVLKLAPSATAAGKAPEFGPPWAEAARRGVSFRAFGNEPSWVLEVADKRLTMITDLGARRTEFPLAEPVVTGATTIWRSAGGGEGLVAVVQRAPCVDGMSGEALEASAAVTFEGEVYKGCGRFLR